MGKYTLSIQGQIFDLQTVPGSGRIKINTPKGQTFMFEPERTLFLDSEGKSEVSSELLEFDASALVSQLLEINRQRLLPMRQIASGGTDFDGESSRAKAMRDARLRQEARLAQRTPEERLEIEHETEKFRVERGRKKARSIENANREAPIRLRFHTWMESNGWPPRPIPVPGSSYTGSHVEDLWDAYLDATLQERHGQ